MPVSLVPIVSFVAAPVLYAELQSFSALPFPVPCDPIPIDFLVPAPYSELPKNGLAPLAVASLDTANIVPGIPNVKTRADGRLVVGLVWYAQG